MQGTGVCAVFGKSAGKHKLFAVYIPTKNNALEIYI
jgi:hypothetical protein